MESLYDILEVSPDATDREIKAAYKRLALKYHPDKNSGDSHAEEKFKSINNAYQILSDPSRKTQYDYNRKNPYFYQNSTYTYSHNNAYSDNTKNTKSWTYTKEDREKDEALAIKWMIGFFIAVIIVSSMIYGWQYFQEKRENEEAISRKMEIIEKVKQKYSENAFRESLKELRVIKAEIPNDDDIDNLYDEVIEQLKKSAEESFNQKNYLKSLDYYTTLKEYEKFPNVLNIFQIAYCHRYLNNYDISINYLELILSESPNDLRSHIDLANIYFENLNNLDKANYHYDKAIQIIISHYKELYGDAYAVMLNIDVIPDIHYEAFTGKSSLRIKRKEYNNSLKESSWAIYIRPENPKAYLLKAEALFELNKVSEAIAQLKIAKKLGSEEAEVLKNKYKVSF